MPYHWSQNIDDLKRISRKARHANGDDPSLSLHLFAHNSLKPKGFVQFIGITAGLMAIPLLAFLGTPFLWIILGCLAAALGLMWACLKISWKRGRISEVLEVWSDHVRLTRHNPNGSDQRFDANPFWIRVEVVESEGPIPHYVTLTGSGRQVQIGAFLSEDERRQLSYELRRVLSAFNQALL